MDDGGHLDSDGETSSEVPMISEEFSTLSIDGGEESSGEAQRREKDPRTIARKYQMDLCQKALSENTIAYLGTGCGKTHIAVLLMYEMRHLIKKPQKNICVFLAPTVTLVEQQAKVIEDSIDIKVGIYCGSSKRLKGHHDWEKEIAQYEVLVMTPQILIHNLSHCFIKIEVIALLIFDECHYAQVESNHPYAEIMKVFYKSNAVKLPRIFGMTASPKLGKGASINSLEKLLHAKVYSVEEKEELEQFVTSPKVNVYCYTTAINSSLMIYYRKLEKIKNQCVLMLCKNTDDHTSFWSTKKTLQRLHGNLIFCLEKLGLWGALLATHILLKGDCFERNELMEVEEQCTDDSLCDRYLAQAATIFASDCMKDGTKAELTCIEVLQEPFFSRKLLRLIDILSNFRLQPNMKCIVFVNRIVTARSLSYILRNLKVLSSWKCDFLVGVHSELKCVSRKTTNIMLEKFRSGELNLLVATKVGEEGLDIQTCCLVIRFDLPETVASFIQSRGRARMPQSEYAFLVDSGNQKELNLIQSFKKDEDQMNEEIECRTTTATLDDLEEKTYKVDSTGATISSGSSISLLHHYCSKLPHDEYFNPKPEFYFFDDADGTICQVILPSNAPIHQISSSPQSFREAAKKDACLQACKELHQLGALTNYLLPEVNEESMEYSSDSDCSDDKDSRRELYEMLVPAALKEQWSNLENSVYLSSYFVKFSPRPVDREYKTFGLFLKVPLPEEVQRMKLDLHLARGRSVMTELVPSTVARFDKDEIVLAEKFQEMFLRVIIDRSKFIPEFVSLGKNGYDNSSSRTFYLMLPVTWYEYNDTMIIDWKLVRRCLSSPIFRMPEDTRANGFPHLSNQLHLANGPKSIDDVVNSLVYAPCKGIFFFVSDVLGKTAYSAFKESRNYVEHYFEKFGIQLSHPNQPLLKAKQLFCLDNLLRKKGHSESRQKEEHFVELPPEVCQLKIIGFSKDIGSSLSLLPSIMHHLEGLLVAFELKHMLSESFPEGAEVTASRVLEALTTEKCNERFSLERLEVLGDAFLKFAVGRHLFLLYDALDEGQLTRKRSNTVKNSNLFKLATANSLQIYIRDQSFDPYQFFALGRPCSVICSKETEKSIHSSHDSSTTGCANVEVRCNKSHHWLHRKTIADVVEALVGAFLVDSGFKAATSFLNWIGIQVGFEASRVTKICSASKIYMPLAAQIDIAALENLLEYPFVHKGLLVQAFVHPSYNSHGGGCYQRLEFLGDAVLDYLITSYLYSVYPKLKPGQLTDLRSMSVNNNCFAGIAINQSFRKFIISDSSSLCKSMDKYIDFTRTSSLDENLVEAPKCPKALGDLVESCIGAILLDTGFDLNRVWKTMLSFLDPVMNFSRLHLNPIRELQELCQSHNWDLDFVSSKKDKTVEVKVNGKDIFGCATNLSRKAAERMAAKQVISTLKEQGYKPKHKSLEDVVKLTHKMEARLIGYDETPANGIALYATEFDNMKAQEPSRSGGSSKVHPITVEPTKLCNSRFKHTRQASSLCTTPECQSIESNKLYSCHADSQIRAMDRDAPSSSSASRTSGVRRRRAAPTPVPPRTRQARRLTEAVIRPGPPDVEEAVPPEVAAEGPSSSTPAPSTHQAPSGASVQIPDLLGRDLSRHPSASLVANEVPEFTQPRGNWFNIYSLYAALHSDYRAMVDSWGFRHFFTIIPRQCPWGYMRALSERWFHQTQSLHLLDCEVVLTPWDWRYITGIEFTGSRVPLDLDITPAEVRALLGFAAEDRVFKARSIRSGALAVDAVGGLYALPIPADQGTRDILLRRLFLTIMRGCFLGNNSSTIHFSVVGAVRDVDRIGDYDWGSFTFAYFLHGMRLRSEGQTDAWLGFYHFLLFWAYERLPCLRPITTLGPDTYPRGRRWHHSTLEEVPVSGSFAHCRIQLELITAADVVWIPYLSEHLTVGFADGRPSGPEFELSTRRLTLQSVGGWVMYLGERAFRCVTGEIRIPHSLSFTTFWPLDSQPSEIMLAGEDGRMLSTGPTTSDAFRTWWVPRTIGPQTRATFFLGDMVPGSVTMTDWAACVRTPTHAEQIASLTRQVDQLSLFIRGLGRAPEEAYTYDPDGAGYDAGPSSSDATAHPYIPDMNFGPPSSTTPGDQFEDPAFIDDTDFI